MQVAEKRKTLLDELAVRYQQEGDHHREQSKATAEAHKTLVNDLNSQLTDVKVSYYKKLLQT